MQISDRALEAFLVLAEVRKFTLAAERCHMTQSAFSQLIARLEVRVGVRLFARGTRSVSLTPEGERLALSARRITAELDGALADLRAIASLEQGQVSVAVLPSLASWWLPRVLQAFRQAHPHIRLHLSDASSARCHDLARQGLVDFAVSSQPGIPGELRSEPLFDETLYIAFPAGHPLAVRAQIGLADLRGVDFIHLQGTQKMLMRTTRGVLAARQVIEDAGARDVGLEVEHLATQAGLVAAGLGACLTPACSLPLFGHAGIARVRLDPAEVVRPVYVSRRREAGLSVAASALLAAVRGHAAVDAPGRPAAAQPAAAGLSSVP